MWESRTSLSCACAIMISSASLAMPFRLLPGSAIMICNQKLDRCPVPTTLILHTTCVGLVNRCGTVRWVAQSFYIKAILSCPSAQASEVYPL